ncbi:hypothetical protein HHI36_007251 [Cryptolaemus montrouzieri]|uniref:Uncharacterized protein n=1 Tax=Cryptolaemus montrouzieri TaxID=559131 RepID=A0ABD2MP50_9CUCU
MAESVNDALDQCSQEGTDSKFYGQNVTESGPSSRNTQTTTNNKRNLNIELQSNQKLTPTKTITNQEVKKIQGNQQHNQTTSKQKRETTLLYIEDEISESKEEQQSPKVKIQQERENWREVVKKRNPKQTRPVPIKGAMDKFSLTIAEQQSCLFLSGLDPDIEPEEVKEYIDTTFKISSKCEKMKTKKDRFKSSFKVYVPTDSKQQVLNENMWGKGIVINHFLHIRRNFNREVNPFHHLKGYILLSQLFSDYVEKLADISRSTRGVVVLLSDKPSAMRILEDAKRLNMMDGHFVWLWIDTSANISFRNVTDDEKEKDNKNRKEAEVDDRTKRSLSESDLSDMNINYLLRNDRYLLFNRNYYGVETSKLKKSRSQEKSIFNVKIDNQTELPSGLLYLRPLPIKVDRHLVKGAVRLLAVALKMVLNGSSDIFRELKHRHFSTSCWRPLENVERNLSYTLGR